MAGWNIDANTVFIPSFNAHKHISQYAVVLTNYKVRHHTLTKLYKVIIRYFVRFTVVQFIDHTVNFKDFFVREGV